MQQENSHNAEVINFKEKEDGRLMIELYSDNNHHLTRIILDKEMAIKFHQMIGRSIGLKQRIKNLFA